jgi:hypothetical protein
MRLARDAANDAIHEAAPLSAAEGSGIAPHRRWSHETLAHRFDQVGDGEGFPLHQTDRASAWDCQLEAKVEPSASAAEGDEVEGSQFGMYSHIQAAPPIASNLSISPPRPNGR